MVDPRKQRISRAFGAAETYDRHAVVQREVARRLAEAIAERPWDQPRVLEVGCGTGFLSAELAQRIAGGRWLLTDLSAPMVARARARLGADPRFSFAVMDGENPQAADGPYDLICSSLAAQWFTDLPGALERLASRLAPGGLLAVATLTEGAFAEWRAAHRAVGLSPGAPAYPSAAALEAMRPAGLVGPVVPVVLREAHEDAPAFLRALKAIGAGTPAPGRAPLSVGQLRQVMVRFQTQGAAVTYETALCLFSRPR